MELLIEDNFSSMRTNLYLREQRGSRTVLLGFDGKYMVEQILGEGVPVEKEIIPLLSFPLMMKDYVLKAFVEAAQKINLNTENENLLKGKLIATESHLADMREIAMKLLKIDKK